MANAQILFPVAMPGLSASSTAAGYAASNVRIDLAGLVWMSATGSASQYLDIDLGVDGTPDLIFLFGLVLPAGATLQVLAATTAQGPSFSSCWTGATLPARAGTTDLVNGRSVGLWQWPAASPPPASRYWRLIFAGLGGGAVTVSRVAVGAAVTLERNFSFGGGFGLKDFSSADFSSRGVFLPRAGVRLRTLGLTFSALRRDEVEAKIQPLLELAGTNLPLALITDPAPDAMRQRRCFYGPLRGELGTIWRNAKAWEWRADMVSLF